MGKIIYVLDINGMSELDWLGGIEGDSFHVGTRFRFVDPNGYDYHSNDVFIVNSLDPNGYVNISKIMDKGHIIPENEITNLNIQYSRFNAQYEKGIFENESVRDDIDELIYEGSEFTIPSEEDLVVYIHKVDEYGNSVYKYPSVDMIFNEGVDFIRNKISKKEWIPKSKNINESDFDWTNDIGIEFGEYFDEYDLGDKIMLNGDTIIYDLGIDELFKINGSVYEDYNLRDLILYNGTYVSDYSDSHESEDEVNYYPSYLKTEQQDRLRKCIIRASKILNLPNDSQTIDSIMTDEFTNSEEYLGSEIYSGYGDWGDTTWNFLTNVSSALEKNRYEYINDLYLSELDRIPFEIEGNSKYEDVSITTKYPHKTNRGFKITNLSEILEYGLDDLFSREWSQVFYDEYDTSGSEVDTRKEFEEFITKIEGRLDELESKKGS